MFSKKTSSSVRLDEGMRSNFSDDSWRERSEKGKGKDVDTAESAATRGCQDRKTSNRETQTGHATERKEKDKDVDAETQTQTQTEMQTHKQQQQTKLTSQCWASPRHDHRRRSAV